MGTPRGATSLSVPCQALVCPEVGAAHGARLWERSKRPPLQFRDVSTGLPRGRLLRSQSLAPCAALSKRPPLQFRDVSTGLRRGRLLRSQSLASCAALTVHSERGFAANYFFFSRGSTAGGSFFT